MSQLNWSSLCCVCFITQLQKKDERLRHAERAAAESARKFEEANNEVTRDGSLCLCACVCVCVCVCAHVFVLLMDERYRHSFFILRHIMCNKRVYLNKSSFKSCPGQTTAMTRICRLTTPHIMFISQVLNKCMRWHSLSQNTCFEFCFKVMIVFCHSDTVSCNRPANSYPKVIAMTKKALFVLTPKHISFILNVINFIKPSINSWLR